MVKLRFRHVEGFRAVMQTGTATGAASLLNVTQPAVSQLMHEMEGVIGITLFDRRGGRLVPTSDAELLFDEVERAFTGLDHIGAFCEQLQRSKAHAVVLAAMPSIAMTLMPNAIALYTKTVARDFFTLYPRHSTEAVRIVGSQKADIGFGTTVAEMPGVHCEPICTFDAICALPVDHPLARRQVVRARDLEGQAFITMSRQEGVHERVAAMLEAEGVTVDSVAESTMSTASCAMVEAGIGVTLVEPGAASVFLSRNIALRRFAPAVPITFYAYWLEKVPPRFKRQAFIDIVKAEAAAMTATLDRTLARPPAGHATAAAIERIV